MRADDLFAEGLRHHRNGELQRASDCYSRALAVRPDHFLALNNAALIAWAFGRIEMALTLLCEAKKYAPTDREILKNLAGVQVKLEDYAGAEAHLRLALQSAGEDNPLKLELATVLSECDKLDEAKSILDKLQYESEVQVPALFKLGVLNTRLGNSRDAISCYSRILEIEGKNVGALNQLADQHLLLGRPNDALPFLEQSIGIETSNSRALSLLAVAFNLLGDRRALLELYSAELYLVETSISVPDGFQNITQFNEKLLAGVEQHAQMREDSPNRATVGGLQSRSISAIPDAAMENLNALFMAATRDMSINCKKFPQHPFSRGVPERYKLESWMVRLQDGGFQRPHNHPAGWLSGCYYLQVPEVVGQSSSQAGYLEFGRPDEIYQIQDPLIIQSYCPAPGKLVTFPSFYWHKTIPFEAAEERICIAFDIRPY